MKGLYNLYYLMFMSFFSLVVVLSPCHSEVRDDIKRDREMYDRKRDNIKRDNDKRRIRKEEESRFTNYEKKSQHNFK